MAATDSTPALGFALERFEWSGDDRLEVAGRWFGVRGRRFVRPTLNVRVGGRRRRLIAVLDHKPWPAEEDAPWVAAFAWRGPHEGVTAARLEVSPDVVIELPLPGSTDASGALLEPRTDQPERRPARSAPREASAADKARRERERLEAALAEARRERDEALARADAAPRAELERALARAEAAEQERDAALTRADEGGHDEITRLRNELAIARAARPESESLQPSRDRAELTRLRRELEAAQAEAAHWRREHESAAPASGEQLAAAQAEASELRAKLRGVPSSTELQRATADLGAAREEITRLKAIAPATAELEAARAEVTRLRGERDAARAEFVRIQEGSAPPAGEAARLRSERDAARAALAQLQASAAGEAERLRAERDEARAGGADAPARAEPARPQQNGDDALRRQLTAARAELEAVKATREDTGEIERLRRELAAAQTADPLPPVRSREERLAVRGITPRDSWGPVTMALAIGFIVLAMVALGLYVLSQV